MSETLIKRLANVGIRSDMPTLQDLVNKPSEEYFYQGKCSNCGVLIRVEQRKDRKTDCKYCGYVLKWKTKLKGGSGDMEYFQEHARTRKK